MTGVNGADPAENQTPSYSAEVELEGNEVNPWPYIHALLCSVSCVTYIGRNSTLHGTKRGRAAKDSAAL